jgi:hypothetical protein
MPVVKPVDGDAQSTLVAYLAVPADFLVDYIAIAGELGSKINDKAISAKLRPHQALRLWCLSWTEAALLATLQ